jgi:cytochrome c oxidase subunit III
VSGGQKSMPGTIVSDEIELVLEKKGGGGGITPPPAGGNGGGGDEGKKRPNRRVSPGRYYTGIAIGIISVLMFFMALSSAFLVRRGGPDWVPVHIPSLLWVNTVVLLASSGTLELARKRLERLDLSGFKRFWLVTTVLGVIFLIGQLVAWRLLVKQGIYLASNPGSSFFFIFTGAHGLHLLGGVGALIYVARRNFDKAKITRAVAAEVASYYWHFMDGLWLFLLALMYLGR